MGDVQACGGPPSQPTGYIPRMETPSDTPARTSRSRPGCLTVVLGILTVLVGIPMLICPGPGMAVIGAGIGLIAVGLGIRAKKES